VCVQNLTEFIILDSLTIQTEVSEGKYATHIIPKHLVQLLYKFRLFEFQMLNVRKLKLNESVYLIKSKSSSTLFCMTGSGGCATTAPIAILSEFRM
jgi:hypothetical protein